MRKIYIIFVIIFSVNIYANSLEERLINPQTQKEAIKELWEAKEAAVPELKQMLDSSNMELREIAINRFMELKIKEATPYLIEQLEKESEQIIRLRIIQYFIKMKSVEAIEILRKLASSNTSPEDQDIAIIGLCNIEYKIINEENNGVVPEKTINILLQNLENPVGEIRMRSAYFLGKFGNNNGYKTAIKDMNDLKPLVREYALEALGEMYAQDILDDIKQKETQGLINIALEDNEIWVRIKAQVIKEKIGINKIISLRLLSSRKNRKTSEYNKKIVKLKEILESDKIIETKIWAANELLDIGEEGEKAAKEIINSNGKGSYVMQKEMSRKERLK